VVGPRGTWPPLYPQTVNMAGAHPRGRCLPPVVFRIGYPMILGPTGPPVDYTPLCRERGVVAHPNRVRPGRAA